MSSLINHCFGWSPKLIFNWKSSIWKDLTMFKLFYCQSLFYWLINCMNTLSFVWIKSCNQQMFCFIKTLTKILFYVKCFWNQTNIYFNSFDEKNPQNSRNCYYEINFKISNELVFRYQMEMKNTFTLKIMFWFWF